MEQGGFVSWDDFKPILHRFSCPCCMGVRIMPDAEELEQRVNDQMDRERVRDKILALEIQNLIKAVEKVEDISGLHKGG